MGEQFLGKVFFHRGEGGKTHPETTVCVRQHRLAVLLIAWTLATGTRRGANNGTILTREP